MVSGVPLPSGDSSVTLGNGTTYTGVGIGPAVPASPLIDSANAGLPTADPAQAELCFVDTLDQISVNHDSALVQMFVNPYAAIPSMHCAFSLMIGVSGALVSRHTITRGLWCAYPLFVFLVVIVTGNHFWLDGAIGWMVAGVAALAAIQLARLRPTAWSWRPATA